MRHQPAAKYRRQRRGDSGMGERCALVVPNAYSTRSVAFIVGCSTHAYANSPAFLAVYFHDRPGAISWESNDLPCAVTVCGNGSWLTQTILSPALTVRTCGSNRRLSINTVCVVLLGAAAAAAQPSPGGRPSVEAVASAIRNGLTGALGTASTLPGKRCLNLLCVLEMRYECRPNLDQQGLEFGVLR